MIHQVLITSLFLIISNCALSQVMTSDNYCKKRHKSTYVVRTSVKFKSDSSFVITSHNYQSITSCSKDSSYLGSKLFRVHGLQKDTIYVTQNGKIIQTMVLGEEFIQFPDSIFEFELDRLAQGEYYRELLIHQEKYR